MPDQPVAQESSPTDQLIAAIRAGDARRTEALLSAHPELADWLHEPLFDFGAPAVVAAAGNLALLDVLLAHGADINARSEWWAGGFGILDHVEPEHAAPLIARGAVVDAGAAAHLGMLERLRELVQADPAQVHARGGDGKTPLHGARTVEVAGYLLDYGADIDARDVDHESTPAQHLVTDRPEVARHLMERGAWWDLFLAIGLGDFKRVRQAVDREPASLGYRINQGLYRVRHDGRTPATPQQIGEGRGDIYRWSLGHDLSPLELAAKLGHQEIHRWLNARSSPAQRLLAACAAADHAAAEELAAAHPGLVASLSPDDQGRLAYLVRDLNREGAALMLRLGFPVDARGQHGGTPLHWAAWRGDLPLVELLLRHGAPLDALDDDFGVTPLRWAEIARTQGWDLHRADDYGPVIERLRR